jgi:hypothetical protein
MSKWGLNDGDIIEDFLLDNELFSHHNESIFKNYDDFFYFDHILLKKLVKKYIIPLIRRNHSIEFTEIINTNHNPIRITIIDGIEVSNYYLDKNKEIKIKPELISIPDHIVIKEYNNLLKEMTGLRKMKIKWVD